MAPGPIICPIIMGEGPHACRGPARGGPQEPDGASERTLEWSEKRELSEPVENVPFSMKEKWSGIGKLCQHNFELGRIEYSHNFI